MTEPQSSSAVEAPAAAVPGPAGRAGAESHAIPSRWIATGGAVLAALCAAAVVYAWNTQQRVKGLEQQLVKRQQESTALATEAQMLSRQAQEGARDATAKLSLLEARVAETTLQRTQLEELIQSMSRSRDENVLADIEASIRLAMQQSEITGSTEALVIVLKQADERLARQNQPRLDGVRRAIAQDLERVRAVGAVDVSTLAIRLDEVVRLVDELPLLSNPQAARSSARAAAPASAASAPASAASAATGIADAAWVDALGTRWAGLASGLWAEVRRLVRVTPIDQPEAMLIAPDQAFFLRENLKLRLLNARLSLLSRQFDTAQADLRQAIGALERYFDRNSRRTSTAIDLLKQVSSQARQVVPPRPDATLTAIATVAGVR